jgi:hypothetical protein
MGKFHFGYILGFLALSLAASAAYISVIGWGQLFAGSATLVMIVMGIIEFAKIVTANYLHKYGKKTNKLLKTYLIISVVATMCLTSVGIYGFLTNAYQVTANKLEVIGGEISLLESKKNIFFEKIQSNSNTNDVKINRINQLNNLRGQQENRLDSLINRGHYTNARRIREDIELSNNEISKLNSEVDVLNIENNKLNDSINYYNLLILEKSNNTELAGEIGPLKYIATLTGKNMDSIINYLVLIIIFIFDPMAISMVLATNRVFDLKNEKGEVKVIESDKIKDIIHPIINEVVNDEVVVNNIENDSVLKNNELVENMDEVRVETKEIKNTNIEDEKYKQYPLLKKPQKTNVKVEPVVITKKKK